MPSIPDPGNGRWRILVHDPDRDDPKWIVATVVAPRDVRPARTTDVTPDEVTSGWVASVAGVSRPELSPMPRAHVWRVDEEDQQ